MIYQTVDLYEYFGKKNMGKGGRLIVYSPDNSDEINADRVRPAILIAPGGGYRNVSFREGEPVALQFLARGFVVFVLSYDVYPFAYPYSPLVEGGMAMKYIRAEGSRYGADTGKVCAAGFRQAVISYLFSRPLSTTKFFGNFSERDAQTVYDPTRLFWRIP